MAVILLLIRILHNYCVWAPFNPYLIVRTFINAVIEELEKCFFKVSQEPCQIVNSNSAQGSR